MSADRPRWTPTSDTSTDTCQNCKRAVSRQFARVFGDNSDVVHACPDCATYRDLHTDGGAAGLGGDGL